MSALRIRAVIIEGQMDDATLELIRDAIAQPSLSVLFAKPSIADVVGQVCLAMGVSSEEIGAASKRGGRARNAICWLAYRVTGKTSGQIGAAIDRNDRTVRYAIARAERLRQRDPAFRSLTARLCEHFTGERP